MLIAADDPYYCGFSARVPNFVKQGKQKNQVQANPPEKSSQSKSQPQSGGAGGSGGQGQAREGARAGGPKYREPGVLPPPSGMSSQSAPNLAHIPQVQPFWWHSRLYPSDVNQGNVKQTQLNYVYFIKKN